jgi:hypothetical protein
MAYEAKGKSARCLVSVGAARAAKASSEGWRLRLCPNRRPTPRRNLAGGTSAVTPGVRGRWEGHGNVRNDTGGAIVGTTPVQGHQRVAVYGRVA